MKSRILFVFVTLTILLYSCIPAPSIPTQTPIPTNTSTPTPFPIYKLSGIVFNDLNGNGVMDEAVPINIEIGKPDDDKFTKPLYQIQKFV